MLPSQASFRQMLIWLVDRAGPAESRLARRAGLVGLRERMVRWARGRSAHHRRLRDDRHTFISQLQNTAPEVPAGIAAPIRTGTTNISGARFGVVIPGFLSGFGGAEKVAGLVAGLLCRNGASVDLICVRSRKPRPFALADGITVRTVDSLEALPSLRGGPYDLLVAFGMPGYYRRIPALAEALSAPFVIQECTNPRAMRRALKSSLSLESEDEAHWLRQAVLAHAAAARFTTPAYAATVEGDIAPFTYAFYNAFVPPQDAGPPTSSNARRYICVGALKNLNKNGLAAAEAFCQFRNRNPGWTLHFYGENNFPDGVSRLQARYPGAIVDEGVETNVDSIYSGSHALIIPSFEEGLPNVVVEALSYGVPCIGFEDCEGVSHLIRHGVNGLLVARREPDALAAAIRELAEPALHDKLSSGARAFASTQLSLDIWESRWLQLVTNALDGRDAAGNHHAPPALGRDASRSVLWRKLLATYPLTG